MKAKGNKSHKLKGGCLLYYQLGQQKLLMLQIDQNEIQVYSCTFRLSLKKLTIPLKVQGHYYFQWKLKTAKQGAKSQMFTSVSNSKNEIVIDQTIELHTQLFHSLKLNRYYKKFTQLTIYLISSKNPMRPKIVGSMMIGLHDVLNNNKYASRQRYKLSFSPLDVSIEFICQSTQCLKSSIFQSNLDSALLSQQNFVVNKQNSLLKLSKQLSKEMNVKRSQYVQDQESYSHRDYSFLQPEKQEMQFKNLDEDELFIFNPQIQVISRERIMLAQDKARQGQKYQWLVKQNKNLKKLLLIAKNEKSIDLQRLEKEIKELIRELSLKQAQLLKLTQRQQSGSCRVGQLLDQSKVLNQKLQICNKYCQILAHRLNIEKNLNNQLDENYRGLEKRLQVVKNWQNQKTTLLQKLQNLKQESQFLKIKNSDLQGKLEAAQSAHFKQKTAYQSQIQSLQGHLATNSSIIQLYEEKFAKFQEEICFMQEEEIVHRSQYSATNISETKQGLSVNISSSTEQKTKKVVSPINIEEEQNPLESINEEELQQSLASIKPEKQIKTSAELPSQQHFQTNFYRKMAKDVQEELNRLRILYQEKDLIIKKERMTGKNLYDQLQRLRFEFVYQLSKVSALLNQKIFQIKQLSEQNFKLKAGKSVHLQYRIDQLNQRINILQIQKLQYFDKCYRLQEQNIALIHLSRQKDKILQLMLQSSQKDNQSDSADTLVQNFERLLLILVNNPRDYQKTLKKHGLLEQSNLLLQSQCKQIIRNSPKTQQLSQLIHNFNRQPSYLLSKFDCGQNQPKSSELLLQSQAKGSVRYEQTQKHSEYLVGLVEQLIKLNADRSKGVFSFKKKQNSEDHQQNQKKMRLAFQNMRKVVVKIDKSQFKQELLRLVKELEGCCNLHLLK